MEFFLFTPRSDEELREYFFLRWKYLRKPFNLPQGSERDAHDDGACHVAAKGDDGQIIGGARLHLNDDNEMQVRYMAVADHCRRRGIAGAMLKHLENEARNAGHRAVTLNAREVAVPFYLSHGYDVTGRVDASKPVVNLPHYAMRKYLDG